MLSSLRHPCSKERSINFTSADQGSLHFLEEGMGRRNHCEHECKHSGPPLYFWLKLRCDPPPKEFKFRVTSVGYLFLLTAGLVKIKGFELSTS